MRPCEEKFKAAAEAMRFSDAEQRRMMATALAAGVQYSGSELGAPGFSGTEDILGDLFGFGDVLATAPPAADRRAARNADLRYDLK